MKEIKVTRDYITLKGTTDLDKRIEVVTLLFKKAETKVTHADTYRQRNMNYSLVIFAGLIALGVKLPDHLSQCIISATLVILMLIFTAWDRRWHKIKHGWQDTAKEAYCKICELTNEPENNIAFPLYKVEAEKKAEWCSWQPIVFYFLVSGAILSFWLFYLV